MNPEIILLFSILLIAAVLIVLIISIRKKKTEKLSKLSTGSRFDNYEIVNFIKRGGMATVFEAINVKTKDKVALKIMHESLMDDNDLVEKFLREGDILEKLNRKFPNSPIVKVFRHSRENNETNGRPFIALELVNGVDLDSFLVNNRPTIAQTVFIVKNVLYALRVAHSEGILHRDISPGNVMIDINNGKIQDVKIIDFGVAKNEYMNKNTPDSSIHGKPPFMSPEQCRNEKLDKRSDIYSLGILFYTLLVGQPPFISKNPLEVMSMHQTDKYPPLPDNFSNDIKNIVNNLLEKDIISRYQNADEVLTDLETLNIGNDESMEIPLNVDDENKKSLIEVVSDVFSLEEQNETDNLPKSSKKKTLLVVGTLAALILIVAYLGFNEISTDSKILIFKKNDSIDVVLNELRKYDVKLNYHFVSNTNSIEYGKLKLAKALLLNSDDLSKKSVISIYLGNGNYE